MLRQFGINQDTKQAENSVIDDLIATGCGSASKVDPFRRLSILPAICWEEEYRKEVLTVVTIRKVRWIHFNEWLSNCEAG